jgi:uncharacterized protein YggE
VNTRWNLVAGAAVVLLIAALVVLQLIGNSQTLALTNPRDLPARTITVVGQGRVSVKPDIAYANLGVQLVAPTASEATGQADEAMSAVIAVLKDLAIDDKDIQTATYNVYPQQEFQDGTPGKITGYQVSSTIRVTVRDLDKLGSVLDQAIGAGVNNIQGITFGIDDPTEAQSAAYDQAVADASARADELARVSDVQVGQVRSINQLDSSSPGPIVEAAVGKGGASTPIESGSIEYQARVQIIYTIQ